MMEIVPNTKAISELAELFHRNGYVRRPNLDRRALTPRSYKKGYEVRLVADSRAEVLKIQKLLRDAGFEPGRAFVKARQWRQPLYGKEAVGRFLELVGYQPEG